FRHAGGVHVRTGGDLEGLVRAPHADLDVRAADVDDEDLHRGVFQPPTSLTRRSAWGGPQLPGSYSYIGLGPWITGSMMAQAASTTSCRANRVASPAMASPMSR